MSETITLSPLKTLFKFPFQGPDWRNRFIVGAALIFAGFAIPIVPGIFVFGYTLQIMRQVIEGRELELPAWDDWGKFGVDGLRLLVVGLAYLLPGLLVMFIGFAAYFGMLFSLPFINSANEGAFMLLMFGSMGVMMLSMTLGMLLLILGFIPLPAATAHFVAEDKVSAAFKVRQWQSLIKVNKLGYFATWVVVLGLAMVLYQLFIVVYSTIILCWLLPLLIAPIGFYIQVVGAAVFAQTYRESKAMAAEEQVALPEETEPEDSAEDDSGESLEPPS
ncbi:MAG TPA: DUF4013 domain-containing protein [Chloroflexi bacterium]|nr:DUF4013 domain-containing protein [Chloroflexota bacterium]